MKRIGDILTRNKTPVVVSDGTSYKQVTIRTNYKGVVLRGSQDGSAILTKSQFRVSPGQFILSRIDARNGAFGIVPDELDGAIVSNEFLAFDINEDEVERDFFNVFLQSPIFLEACIKASRGNTNRKRVEEDFFLNYQVNLPPLREQHTLIKQINHGRANIATAQREITHQETLLAKLQQAILQEAIQGKLTADWRAAHPQAEPASQLLHRIQAEKSRLIAAKQLRPEKPLPKITPAEIPFAIPKTWEWCRLLAVSNEIHYGFTASADPSSNDTRLLRITDIQDDQVEWKSVPGCRCSEKEREKYLLRVGDILIARTGGTVGKSYLVDSMPVQSVFASYLVRVVPSSIELATFVKLYLGSPCYWSQISDAARGAQPNVSGSKLKRLLIPLPPLAEQAAIVARVDSLLGSSRLLAGEIAHTRTHAADLLQAVLKEAFTPAA